MKKALAAAFTAAAVATLAACTSSPEPTTSAPPSTSPTETEAPQETFDVRVAALPIAETGALWAAIDEGIFAKHGINIEIVPAQGGAQAIPALLSGDIQFAIGQPFGPFRADAQDLGVVIIGDYADSLATGKDVNAVVALNSSGIDGPADLAGKNVSVNSLGAAGDVTIMKAVEDAGGDPMSITFVEAPFPEVPAQLDAGNIDAGWVPDPFMSIVAGGEGHIVVHPYQATIPGLSVLTNITLQETIDSNPQLVAQYSAAMKEALEWAAGNEDAVRAALVTNLEIPEEAAAGITLPTFTFDLNVDNLKQLADLAVGYGVLEAAPNFDRMIQQQ
jgi:NitT/TauT family transport system substrate-binding protein